MIYTNNLSFVNANNDEAAQLNNQAYICGEIVEEANQSFERYGERFYVYKVKILRLSGQADILPVTISERILQSKLSVGEKLCAYGQFRSYNKIADGKQKLFLTIWVQQILEVEPSRNPNQIVLSGYLCKMPTFRTTPSNREITDLLVAVNRGYGKSDYIPCVVWGRNAQFAAMFSVGDEVSLLGRIQSREYQKVKGDGTVEIRTAYEVSASAISHSSRQYTLDFIISNQTLKGDF